MRRRILTTLCGAPLPYKRRLAYIESDGESWIDTLFIPPKDDCAIKCRGLLGDYNGEFSCLFNSFSESVDVRQFSFGWRSSGTLQLLTNFGDCNYNKTGGISTSFSSEVVSVFLDTTPSAKIDDTVFGLSASIKLDLLDSSISLLFCKYNQVFAKRGARIYSFSAERKSTGEKLIELIPVMSLDDEPCLYDEVSGRLFRNSGTGTFGYAELET